MGQTEIEQLCRGLGERDASLVRRAVSVLSGNRLEGAAELFGGRTMLSPAVSFFQGVWNWDSAFHAMALAFYDPALAADQIEGFLSYMKEDGMLPDCVKTNGRVGWHSSKPPVFAYATMEVYRRTGNRALLENTYDRLVRNAEFWQKNRRDGRLFFYSSYQKGTPAEERKWAQWESGLDDSPRWDNGIVNLFPVDLNGYMLLTYRSLAEMAERLGRDGRRWADEAEALAEEIEATFWDEAQGAYVDRDRFTGAFSTCLTPASFLPLFVGTASAERAKKMADLAADPKKFNATMPTVAFDDPSFSDGYWRGPLWMNVAYFAAKGLKQYGFPVADAIRENILNLVDSIPEAIYENYDLIRRAGTHAKDFSWSACFLLEFILNWRETP